MTTPARLPSALICCTVRCKLSFPSQCTRNESDPALTNSSRKKSGSEIIRWISKGKRVTRRSDWTIGAPIEMLGTKCPSITSTWMRSAPARSASATCSPKRAKSAARIEGASFTASFSILVLPSLLSGTACMSSFKNVHKLPIAAGYLCHSLLPRRLLVPPVDERVPEVSPTHSETDETRNSGRCRQPLANFCLVLTPPQDDAADFAATASARTRYNLRAVLAAVQSLDFPHVRLHLSVLKLPDSLDHQPRSQLQVVCLFVAFELRKLRLLRRHQQLEHQRAATFTTQVVREPLQTGRLAAIESLVALGVVAHQYLAEGRLEALDVLGELLAVFKVELLLPALLCRTGGRVTLLGGVTKYGRTELLVHQDAGFFFGYPAGHRSLETIVDHLLGR